jgi:hypothetical protein
VQVAVKGIKDIYVLLLVLDVLVRSFKLDSFGLPGKSASLVRSVNIDLIFCRLEKQFLTLI